MEKNNEVNKWILDGKSIYMLHETGRFFKGEPQVCNKYYFRLQGDFNKVSTDEVTNEAKKIFTAITEYDKLKSDNEVLLSALKSVQNIVSFLINTTPTGDNRNRLTHANILSLEAIKQVEK
jgi:hypothetical protein